MQDMVGGGRELQETGYDNVIIFRFRSVSSSIISSDAHLLF
jgi:hypothetical protein